MGVELFRHIIPTSRDQSGVICSASKCVVVIFSNLTPGGTFGDCVGNVFLHPRSFPSEAMHTTLRETNVPEQFWPAGSAIAAFGIFHIRSCVCVCMFLVLLCGIFALQNILATGLIPHMTGRLPHTLLFSTPLLICWPNFVIR